MALEHSSSSFVDTLIALRKHYQSLLSSLEDKATQTQEQLSHINALLADQFVPQQEHPHVALQAQIQVTEPFLVLNDLTEPASDTTEIVPAEAPSATLLGKHTQKASASQTRAKRKAISGQDDDDLEDMPLIPEHVSAQVPTSRKGNRPQTKHPLLPAYAGLSKIEAITKVIQENAGKIVHVDQLINTLHGELSGVELKAERDRMRNTLNRGMSNGQWQKVKGRVMSYTLDSKLLKASSAKQTELKSAAKPAPSLSSDKQEFRLQSVGKSLPDAVEKLMQAHRGEAMTTDSVAKILFADVDDARLSKIKKQLNTTFSRGVMQGRWQRVKGQKGAYVLG
jgi:hypothetical protein